MATPLIGTSESTKRIRKLIENLADASLNILITGESGVGKEVVAQNLYHESKRQGQHFIKVNCAAMPEELIESELFGFEKGAFTDTDRHKRGIFDLVHQGVIFIDEIGDMSPSLQSKLINLFQNGEFSPFGSEKELRPDLWVIATSKQNLEKKVKGGLFREDLYYRLNNIKLYIPPLRNRPEDIPPLIDYYIEEYSSEFSGKKISKPDSKTMERLKAYSWPGNVRELQNIISRFKVFGNWKEIIEDLHLKSRSIPKSRSVEKVIEGSSFIDVLIDLKGEYSLDHASFSLKNTAKKAVNRLEKEIISFVLDMTEWNRTKASKVLDISYKTLLIKINEHDINKQPKQRPLRWARLQMSF